MSSIQGNSLSGRDGRAGGHRYTTLATIIGLVVLLITLGVCLPRPSRRPAAPDVLSIEEKMGDRLRQLAAEQLGVDLQFDHIQYFPPFLFQLYGVKVSDADPDAGQPDGDGVFFTSDYMELTVGEPANAEDPFELLAVSSFDGQADATTPNRVRSLWECYRRLPIAFAEFPTMTRPGANDPSAGDGTHPKVFELRNLTLHYAGQADTPPPPRLSGIDFWLEISPEKTQYRLGLTRTHKPGLTCFDCSGEDDLRHTAFPASELDLSPDQLRQALFSLLPSGIMLRELKLLPAEPLSLLPQRLGDAATGRLGSGEPAPLSSPPLMPLLSREDLNEGWWQFDPQQVHYITGNCQIAGQLSPRGATPTTFFADLEHVGIEYGKMTEHGWQHQRRIGRLLAEGDGGLLMLSSLATPSRHDDRFRSSTPPAATR